MSELFAGLFSITTSGDHVTGGTLVVQFPVVENIGVRFNVDSYGVERIEVTIKVSDETDQYIRMANDLGGDGRYTYRLAIYDECLYQVVSGYLIEIEQIGVGLLKFVAKGPGWNHSDRYGPTYTSYTSSDTTSDQLKQFLDDDVYILQSDLGNVDETGTPLGGWSHPPYIGMHPSEFIEQIKTMSNSNGDTWDYYCLDRVMLSGALRDFTAYFKNRNNKTSVNWRVSMEDLVSFSTSIDITKLNTYVVIWYGTYQGTATGGGATQLIDSGATFGSGPYNVGDEVRNQTDNSTAKILEIVSNTELKLTALSGGSSNVFSAGNSYSIKAEKPYNFATSSGTTLKSNKRYYREHRKDFTQTQAAQYAQSLYDYFSIPIRATAFNVASRTIRDVNGTLWPLWQVLFDGGGVIEIDDLFPSELSGMAQGTNNTNAYFIRAVDYDNKSNQLRIAVNDLDGRLDSRLKRAGILGSEMIARGS